MFIAVQLFWPDDQKWYMVRIQNVDVENKTARSATSECDSPDLSLSYRIAYLSGEVEDLDMTEIVMEGHLSLLP